MRRSCAAAAASCLLTLGLAGCRPPGKPGPDHVPPRPDQQMNFDVLYKNNCRACHGDEGKDGMAISLANPAYIAYAGADHIAAITANGIGGSLMPAFAKEQGGLLTDQQIRVLADGIVSHWGRPSTLGGATPPPYESGVTGDGSAGEALYRNNCLRCHAPGPSSILSPTYLALISNGGLRTWIVAGKPSAGMPDWRGYPGGPLSDQQIADIVSFLTSHRTAAPGQAFPNAAGAAVPSANATAAAQKQQRLASRAGPATGGPLRSSQPIPTNTPEQPVSPKP